MASAPNEFVDYVLELMAGWSPVTARRMFGGYGLYREGLMFALIVDDELFLKADADSAAQLERLGCHPFVYNSQTRTVQLSYWSAPEDSLESAAEMSSRCQYAYAVALRAQAAKTGRSGKGKRK